MEYSFFVLLIFLLYLMLKHGKKKSIKQTKNAPYLIHNGNEPFKLVLIGDNLPWTNDYNYYKYIYCFKKKISLFIYVHAQ